MIQNDQEKRRNPTLWIYSNYSHTYQNTRKPYLCKMIQFYKYHGAGNDFIIFNCLNDSLDFTEDHIAYICDRHTGIGADGVMFLLKSEEYDFEMKYYNSDGKEGTMCGNGGRCMISFAYDMGIIKDEYRFIAVDGKHYGKILEINAKEKTVELQMTDVNMVNEQNGKYVIDTGSPHYLDFRENIENLDVYQEGRSIRYSEQFEEEGINVNFIESRENKLYVRTYERGVENETLACGTGVTAAAIAMSLKQKGKYSQYDIQTLGGDLHVRFQSSGKNRFTNIFLTGPATYVFTGALEL
jgi:diaminopimelate epimerase